MHDIRLKPAGRGDHLLITAMARDFYAEGGHHFTDDTSAAIAALIARPEYGRVWLLVADDKPVGYAIICLGFSIEFGGRDCILDEIYVTPDARGRRVASRAIELMAEEARAIGCRAIHLEVMDDNPRAGHVYERLGFRMRPSRYMWKTL